jgi:hypothetical protein
MRAALVMLAGCIGGGAGLDLPVFDVVYLCATDAGPVEVCWDGYRDDLEHSIGGQCEPTPRHLGPCLYSCPPPESGCNSLHGCYCP